MKLRPRSPSSSQVSHRRHAHAVHRRELRVDGARRDVRERVLRRARDAPVGDLVDWLPRRARAAPRGGARTGVCGVDAFKVAISAGVEQNLAQMDVIVLPLALLILGLIIRNPGS